MAIFYKRWTSANANTQEFHSWVCDHRKIDSSKTQAKMFWAALLRYPNPGTTQLSINARISKQIQVYSLRSCTAVRRQKQATTIQNNMD